MKDQPHRPGHRLAPSAVAPTDRYELDRQNKSFWMIQEIPPNPSGLAIKQGRTMAEDEPSELGPWADKLFKYKPPKDVGGPPLWVMKYDEQIWLGFDKEPKTTGDIGSTYKHIVTENRGIDRRLKMGEWLRALKPSNDELLSQQLFLEVLDPVPFDELFDDSEETPEGQAVLEQIDMAVAVIDAGGACTVCGVEPVDKHVPHKVGCYLPGFMIWRMLHPEDLDRTPSLAMVIQAANEQIARMR